MEYIFEKRNDIDKTKIFVHGRSLGGLKIFLENKFLMI